MRRHKLAAVLATGAFLALGGAAIAHHSYAMFDPDNPIDLAGVVQEFKFGSPHTFIILKVKDADGNFTSWSLEGLSATALVREGWSSKAIHPGDELIFTIAPLRSGAPGGAWNATKIKLPDGRPLVIAP